MQGIRYTGPDIGREDSRHVFLLPERSLRTVVMGVVFFSGVLK